ncbi:hypothetical protein BpOF4_21769 (plasmid) [Alkalihalophilus pseudofirmus OF4]|uniref:Uncharacterized protein n=1 Tax=Alkalihalophilus pseudofirmus (strain ATCC BAA-2126 / JCM 17055 / OF4) TaxID=398511 RepID=D3G1X3_ALKPO|nr:hypothetical protein BpOF4_21769 [Alkalihalophilus pseudofirmus OF4]
MLNQSVHVVIAILVFIQALIALNLIILFSPLILLVSICEKNLLIFIIKELFIFV